MILVELTWLMQADFWMHRKQPNPSGYVGLSIALHFLLAMLSTVSDTNVDEDEAIIECGERAHKIRGNIALGDQYATSRRRYTSQLGLARLPLFGDSSIHSGSVHDEKERISGPGLHSICRHVSTC